MKSQCLRSPFFCLPSPPPLTQHWIAPGNGDVEGWVGGAWSKYVRVFVCVLCVQFLGYGSDTVRGIRESQGR